MTPKERLNKLFDEIVRHGYGQMSVNVAPRGDRKTKILIVAGKSYDYTVDNIELEDD